MAANRIRSMFPVAPRKGETFELRTGLNSQFAHERYISSTFPINRRESRELHPWLIIRVGSRKDAIRNTIAAMTLGKDVSALFPDIIKNMVGHSCGSS